MDSWKLKKYIEIIQDRIMAADVAKPFKILSAYFTTTATNKPPADESMIASHTAQSYPLKKPDSDTSLPSFTNNVIKPTRKYNTQSGYSTK